jgi:putative endonuclease
MTLARQQLGMSGESLAVAELERRGYAILARRYRTKHGEIDVVADDRGITVFVEVKARTTREFGSAAEAVTPWKQRRLVSMAGDYLVRNRLTDRPCRFDVVTVDFVPEQNRGAGSPDAPAASAPAGPEVVVYVNAFDA